MEPASTTTDNKLTSDRIKAFEEALSVLYIHRNGSGRLKFVQEWPDAAPYILGEQLIGFDRTGTLDKELRMRLEVEAEARRFDLLQIVETIEDQSAERGVLKTEYVQDVLSRVGRQIGLLLYSTRIVNRFIPPDPSEQAPVQAAPAAVSEAMTTTHAPVLPEPVEILPDTIIPVETGLPQNALFSAVKDEDLDPKAEEPIQRHKPSEGDHGIDTIQPISIEADAAPALSSAVSPVASFLYDDSAAAIMPIAEDAQLVVSTVIAPVYDPDDMPPPEKPPQEPQQSPAKTGSGRLKIFGIKDSQQ